MGLLDDYGVDLSEIEAASFDVEDGVYEFTLGEVFVQEGTANHPDKQWLVFKYLLGDEGKSTSEWFLIPEDASEPTAREEQSLSFLKTRLLSLGVPEEQVNSVGSDELVGIVGTLQLKSTKAKDGNTYQNVKNVRVTVDETNDFQSDQEEETVKPVKTSAPSKTAATKAAPKPPAKVKPATAVENPFQ